MAAGDGLISMTPTSIAYSGTSASINADGGVDFSAVTSLSLNGVFTGDYDNYLIVANFTDTGANVNSFRLRASGVDASGANYVRQWIDASGSSVSGFRSGSSSAGLAFSYTDSTAVGQIVHLYGPYLTQPTASRGVNVNANSGARILDIASTHSLSASYDGMTLFAITSMTGNIHVFGYEE